MKRVFSIVCLCACALPASGLAQGVSMETGVLTVQHDLVPIRSLSQERRRQLVYSSATADPRPIISVAVAVASNSLVPLDLRLTSSLGGLGVASWYETFRQPANSPPVPMVLASQLDVGEDLPTGVYLSDHSIAARFDSSNLVAAGTPAGGAAAGRNTSAALPGRSQRLSNDDPSREEPVRVPHVNRIESPFGAGWTLRELERLYFWKSNPFEESILAALLVRADNTTSLYVIGNRSNILFCTTGCKLFDGASEIGPIFPGGQGSNEPRLGPNGEWWDWSEGGAAGAAIRRYSQSGEFIEQFQLDGVSVGELLYNGTGDMYALGNTPGGTRIFRILPGGTLEGIVPQTLRDQNGNVVCPFSVGTGTAVPFDPAAPDKLEILAVGEGAIYRVDLNDEFDPCKGVAAQFPTGPYNIRRVRVDVDGTIFFYARPLVATGSPLQGIYRVPPDSTVPELIIPQVLDANDGKSIQDFAIGPDDGLLYVTVNRPSPGAVERFDPVTGQGISSEPYISLLGETQVIEFAAREQGVGDDGLLQFVSPVGDYTELVQEAATRKFIRKLTDGTTVEYDEFGRQTARIDRNGNVTAYEWESGPDGRLVSITDPMNAPTSTLTTTISYGTDGLVDSFTDHVGRVTSLDHDEDGNLIAITDPDLLSRRFEYDDVVWNRTLSRSRNDGRVHRMRREVTKSFDQTEYVYDFTGRVRQIVNPDDPASDPARINPAGPACVVDRGGEGLDGRGSTPEPPFFEIVGCRNTSGTRFASFTDQDGVRTEYQLAGGGRATSATLRADGEIAQQSEMQVDEAGRVTGVAETGDPGYTYEYDARGNVTEIVDRRTGGVTTFRYGYGAGIDELGGIEAPTGLTGIQTDERGNAILVATPEQQSVSTSYYDNGLPHVISTAPVFTETTLTYDQLGNLVSSVQTDGTSTRGSLFTNTAEGYVDTVTDSLNNTSDYDYDDMGRVDSLTLPDQSIVRFEYGPAVERVVPPGQPAHESVYGRHGLALYSPPDVGDLRTDTGYEYTPAGRLTGVLDPSLDDVGYTYDEAGRLQFVVASSTDPGIPETVVESTYGQDGLLESLAAFGLESLTFAYTNGLRTGHIAEGAAPGSYSRSFDASGRLVSEAVDGSTIATFTYDGDSRLSSAGELVVTRSPTADAPVETSLRNISQSLDYDAFGNLRALTVTHNTDALYSINYTRDSTGRITGTVETVSGSSVAKGYTYDGAGRLETTTEDGALVRTYSYDQNGNRVSLTTPSLSRSGVYDAQDRLSSWGSLSYTYTPDGDLRSKTNASLQQITTYGYDPLGNLRYVDLPGGEVVDYSLDARQRRNAKYVDGEQLFGLLYRDALNPIAQLDADGAVVSTFVYGTRSNVPDYMVRSGSVYALISDHLGSVRLVVDADSGDILQRLDYDEFGNVLVDTNPGVQPFGFAGGIYDPDTGLTRFGARDYDPVTGRWTAQDPLRFDGGQTNLYVYVGNDPVNLSDPSGLIAPVLVGVFIAVSLDALRQTYVEDRSFLYGEGNVTSAALAATLGALTGGLSSAVTATGSTTVVAGVTQQGITNTVLGVNAAVVSEIITALVEGKTPSPQELASSLATSQAEGEILGQLCGAFGLTGAKGKLFEELCKAAYGALWDKIKGDLTRLEQLNSDGVCKAP